MLDKIYKPYLMIAGTFVPAYAAITMIKLIKARNNEPFDAFEKRNMFIFGALTIGGAILTAKLLNK